MLDEVHGMNFNVAYAVCCGTTHICKQMECQDFAYAKVLEKGAIIVLADGAGSCERSLTGAKTVVTTTYELLAQWCEDPDAFEDPLNEKMIIRECLISLADNGYPIEQQSSTLLFCAVRKNGQYILGHLGDGYIFKVCDRQANLLSDAENGLYNNETYFVTGLDAEAHLRIQDGVLQNGEAILLCSDGAGEALYDRQNKICAQAVATIAGWLHENTGDDVSKAIANSLDEVVRRRTMDDMGIAVLACMTETYGEDLEEKEGKNREL